MSRLRDNVERWLIHENYDFKQGKSDDATFKIIINNSDGLGNDTEVFEPKGQENILVIGIKIDMKTKQLIRFRELNEIEQENFKKKVDDFCYSIKAIFMPITKIFSCPFGSNTSVSLPSPSEFFITILNDASSDFICSN